METLNAHVISRVVLKQFGNGRHLKIKDKQTNSTVLVKPKQTAFVEHLREDIIAAENTWELTETHAMSAIKQLKNGTILMPDKTFYADILKRLIAIHYVRSISFYAIKDKYALDKLPELLGSVAQDIGRPLTPEQIKYGIERWKRVVDESTAKMLINNYNLVSEFVSRYGLEIGVAADGAEFIIGDTPVLTMTKDGKLGITNGVRIDDADAVAMPITKKHLVALKKDPTSAEYIMLSRERVNAANSKQVAQAIRYFYVKPDGPNDI